jgi:hypothetical protein
MADAPATFAVPRSRFLNRHTAILLSAVLLLGDVGLAFGWRPLSPQERQLVGPWQVNVTSHWVSLRPTFSDGNSNRIARVPSRNRMPTFLESLWSI